MPRTRILTSISTALAAMLFAGTASIAVAHEAGLHHWFEHERARAEGTNWPIFEYEDSNSSRAGRKTAAAPEAKRNDIASAPDCLIEQLKASEGYIPVRPCRDEYSDRRWVVDEDKELGRHAKQTRPR